MSTFEYLVLMHLTGHVIKAFTTDKMINTFVNGALVGSLIVYLFIVMVLM